MVFDIEARSVDAHATVLAGLVENIDILSTYWPGSQVMSKTA